MKKSIFTIILTLFSLVVFGQEVYNLDNVKHEPKTEIQLIGKSTKTKDKAIYKGTEYPVYKSVNDKLFIIYLNSKNNYSKKYIK